MILNSLVNSTVLQRVFELKVEGEVGTAFIVETAKGKFLVTARHLFEKIGFPNTGQLFVSKDGKWEKIDNQIHYHKDSSIDIAVVKTSYFDKMSFDKVKYSSSEMLFSQELFILGYPYGLKTEFYNINRGYPFPFIKKGIFSGKAKEVIIADCDNNQGFSGGPVVFHEIIGQEYSTEISIAGVVHGYFKHTIDVVNNKKENVGHTYENSGMTIIYPIEFALDIIREI